MNIAAVLPDPRFLRLDQIVSQDDSVTIHLHSIRQNHFCPNCGSASSKRHSRYIRRLADLPLCGVRVRLLLRAAKLFCLNDDCPCRIFVEPLPNVAARYARRTVRAAELLRSLAFYLGGRAGAKLAHELKLSLGKDTLLRQLRRVCLPRVPAPRVVGVDDFAFRRGRTYGTILIDLERRQPIDLLPDRNIETLQQWLAKHLSIEVVSRDRSHVYAEAIRTGAPAATQVADRFHLLKNIFEVFERTLHRSRGAIAESAAAVRQINRPPATATAMPTAQTNYQEFENPKAKWRVEQQSANRQKRVERYEAVKGLHAEGCSLSEIGRRLRMHR